MARQRNRRVDDEGWAFKGSQLQFQLYVNRYCDELNDALRASIDELREARILWRAPLERDGLLEPRDERFLELAGLDSLREALDDFWPRGGPVWDGVARVALPNGAEGVALVEAKSYPRELESACRATPPSRQRIEGRLRETREWLGVDDRFSESWLDSYYQLANRLAHLRWLCEQRVPTWLVLVGLTGDRWHVPTTDTEWGDGLRAVGNAMGVYLHTIDGLVHVILEARERPELSAERLAYLRTDVSVRLGSDWIGAAEAAHEFQEVVHVLTAWNPGTSRPSDDENRSANHQLREELVRRHVEVYPAIGTSWSCDHAEESYAVTGLDRSAARELGRMFGQEAVFEVSSDVVRVIASSGDWEYSLPA
jgi:hypothetical protein